MAFSSEISKSLRLFDILHDAVVATEEDYTVVFWNRAAEEMFGVPASEALGRSITELIDVPDGKAVLASMSEALRSRGSWRGETEFMLGDGEPIYLDWSVRTVELPEGGFRGLIAVARDITLRKRDEKALRESEERFRDIGAAARDAIIMMDGEGRISYWNDAASRIFGYSAEEVLGKDIHAIVMPESFREAHIKAVAEFRKTGQGAAINKITELKGLRQDGSEFPIELSLTALQRHGQWHALGIVRDISERKKAEEAVLKLAKGVSASSGESFFPVLVRHLAEALDADYAMIAEVIGEKPDRARTLAVYAGGEPADNFEYDLEGTPCGQVQKKRHCFFSNGVRQRFPEDQILVDIGVDAYMGVPLRDSAGRVIGLLAVMYKRTVSLGKHEESLLDIFSARVASEIERMRMEKERRALEEEFRQVQKLEAVGRLAGGIAHDFNNIMTGINGYAEMILSSLTPDDPFFSDVMEIQKAGKRAAGLTNHLLAFSRRQIIAPKVLDINQVVADSYNMLARFIGEDVDLVFVPGKGIWSIKVDPAQIDQILANLAVNARDAMIDGGKLTIETTNVVIDEKYCRTRADFRPGEYLMIAVSDSGHGMDAETMEHIFEPFFSTKEKDKGTGLGLSTVYGIVKQNRGFIDVYSEPGVGASFKIYFPRVMEEAAMPLKDSLRESTRGREVILLVEDEEMVRRLVRRVLEKHGYTVIEAGDGVEALRVFSAHRDKIRLLLSDVIMPAMNGRELYRKLKEQTPDIKVLFMSGYTENVIAHHGVLDSGTPFLQKPFTIEALARKVRRVLDS